MRLILTHPPEAGSWRRSRQTKLASQLLGTGDVASHHRDERLLPQESIRRAPLPVSPLAAKLKWQAITRRNVLAQELLQVASPDAPSPLAAPLRTNCASLGAAFW